MSARTLDVVAMSEDGVWFAFPNEWSRRAVASELVHNMADWWWSEHEAIWIDDEDKTHGWVTAARDLFGRIQRGFVRKDTERQEDWWWEVAEADEGAEPCWIVWL